MGSLDIYLKTKEAFDNEAQGGIFTKEMNECDRLSLAYLSARIKPQDKVLSVGAGYGNVIEKLNCEKYALDISEEMLKHCNIENKTVGNFDKIPFKDQFFDVLFGICAFQHSKNPAKTLKEWERVAKTVVIIDGDKDSSIGKEREQAIKEGTWKTVGEAQWLSAKDFPNYEANHLASHILVLSKTK